MYKCQDCGATFDAPRHVTETHGLDGPPYEELHVCPNCGGAPAEALQCDSCGEWFTPDEYYRDGWCYECARKAYTDELGFSFITKTHIYRRYEYSDDFKGKHLVETRKYDFKQEFIESYYGVNIDGSGTKLLVNILLSKHGLDLLSDDPAVQGVASDSLKRFCLDDMDYWIDFLKEAKQ